jgi:DNA polymerase III epsilon subunit-like protein
MEPMSTDVSSESSNGDVNLTAHQPNFQTSESLENTKKRKASNDIFAPPKATHNHVERIQSKEAVNVELKHVPTKHHKSNPVQNLSEIAASKKHIEPIDESIFMVHKFQKSSAETNEVPLHESTFACSQHAKRTQSTSPVQETRNTVKVTSLKYHNGAQNLPQTVATNKYKESTDESIFASPVVEQKKQKLSVEPKVDASHEPGPVNFRNLSLPIASFSTTKNHSSSQKSKATTSSNSSDDDADITLTLPIPRAPESMKWINACLKSRAHAKYHSLYNFEKYKSIESQSGIAKTWIKTRPYGAWCRKNPQVIAIDCEMCETTCPLTGIVDGKALCRLSVINGLNPDEILIDTLVKPDWPVTDYRTRIHGIEPSNLQSVEFTLMHAQSFMMALCSEETVIIGHAVHNDLMALKMEHYCVADSSFLFEVQDAPGVTPSLRDLAIRVLKLEMPNIHDSVHDARISLQCLEEGYIKTGGSPSPIERFYPAKGKVDATANNSSLLIHRIPRICKENHIHQLFLSQTSVQPSNIPVIEFTNDTGRVVVSFPSPAHAKLAFDFMSGRATEDKGGKLQKKVYLKNGDYIVVRENSSRTQVGTD